MSKVRKLSLVEVLKLYTDAEEALLEKWAARLEVFSWLFGAEIVDVTTTLRKKHLPEQLRTLGITEGSAYQSGGQMIGYVGRNGLIDAYAAVPFEPEKLRPLALRVIYTGLTAWAGKQFPDDARPERTICFYQSAGWLTGPPVDDRTPLFVQRVGMAGGGLYLPDDLGRLKYAREDNDE